MDVFCEYIVTKKKGVKESLLIAGIALLAAFLVSVCGLFFFTQYGNIAFLLTVGIVLGSYYLIKMFNIEYEYMLTNGEIDVDRIRNRAKRDRLITVKVKDFQILAPTGKAEFSFQENANFTRVIDASSTPDSDRAYFAVFSKDGQTIKLIFEPSDRMLENIRLYIPSKVK